MPKKKSEKKKNKKENKEEEQEIPEEEPEEESSLEEEIEDIEKNIDTKQFRDFMQHDFHIIPQEIEIEEAKAPVLEKVNPPQENITSLEWDLMQSTDFDRREKSDEDDPFKYKIGGGNQREEPKYHHYEEVAGISRIEIENLGKTPFSERLEVGRMTTEKKFETQNQEQYTPAKIRDIQELGKENPNEKKEVKYTPSKY